MLITQTKQKGQTFLLAQLNCQVNQHAAKTILISVIISKSIKNVCVCVFIVLTINRILAEY